MFIKSFITLFIQPTTFLRDTFQTTIRTHFWYFAFGLYFIATIIEQINKRVYTNYIKVQSKSEALQEKYDLFLSTWINYFYVVLISLITIYLVFLIARWWYGKRIQWSKGVYEPKQAGAIMTYSWIYYSLLTIVSILFSVIMYDSPKEAFITGELASPILSWIEVYGILIAGFLLYIHSSYISFSGVCTLAGCKKNLALVWFMILPIVYYILGNIALFLLLINATR